MSAAQGGFQFAAINAADVQGLSTAIIAQLNVFYIHFETRMNELMEPDISQMLEERTQVINASLEMQLAVALTEMTNRITRAEMRNEEIAAAGNRVVGDMAAWTTQTTAMMQQNSLEFDKMLSSRRRLSSLMSRRG